MRASDMINNGFPGDHVIRTGIDCIEAAFESRLQILIHFRVKSLVEQSIPDLLDDLQPLGNRPGTNLEHHGFDIHFEALERHSVIENRCSRLMARQ